MKPEAIDALVIGGGPAGLMAAEALVAAGRQVLVAEAKPSLGRKLLMAGKSGLNLTKDEPFEPFLEQYHESAPGLAGIIEEFGPDAVQDWARGLGQEVFTGTSARVFPVAMKASPLLRAWLGRLARAEVAFRTRWRWLGWQDESWRFETPDGAVYLTPRVVVLALGGASWPRLGSDGAWFDLLRDRGVQLAPFQPANAGLRVEWSGYMARHFGAPVKGVALKAGSVVERGEFVVSARGLEGGGIYALTREVRDGQPLSVDLVPDLSEADVTARLKRQNPKDSVTNRLRKALRLAPIKLALLMEFGRPLPGHDELARLVKALPIRHAGPRPIAEAISTAGGVAWSAVDNGLMLRALPGVFVAGEMLAWEAPTGGYLLTGCLATGLRAGRSASGWKAA